MKLPYVLILFLIFSFGFGPFQKSGSYDRDGRTRVEPLTQLAKTPLVPPSQKSTVTNPQVGTTHHTFSGGRSYELYVPKNVKSLAPLVICFHGGGSYGTLVAWESNFNKVADANGFVICYPNGTAKGLPAATGLTWNDGRPYLDGSMNLVDDIGFTQTVISDVSTNMAIDPTRVYACGYSNGAQFCYRLARSLPQKFAAFGMVAGQRGPDEFGEATQPVSIISFSGMRDTIAPYIGGKPSVPDAFQTTLRAAPQVAAQWARFDVTPQSPFFVGDKGQAVAMAWGPGLDNSDIAFWSLKDGGHTWPGGNVEPSLAAELGAVNKDIFAADLMWTFFSRHQSPSLEKLRSAKPHSHDHGYNHDHPRSGKWGTVRDHWLTDHPTCAACGTDEDLDVHHILPFSSYPEAELDPENDNLITLCRLHHQWIGHSGNFRFWNPHVKSDAALQLKRVRERLKAGERLPGDARVTRPTYSMAA